MTLNFNFNKTKDVQKPTHTTALPAAKSLDLEAAKKPFKKYELKIAEMKQKVDALVVNDDETVALATEMASQISKIVKTMEEERKKTIVDPDAFVRGINTFFRGFKSPMDSMTQSIKKKLGDHSYKKELARRKAEAEAKALRDKQQAELDKAAAKHSLERVVMPTMVVPKKQEPVRTESGSSSTRYKWTFEIVDAEKITAVYLVPDEKKIQQAIDAGIRDIGGVRIYEKPIVSIRQ